MFVELLAPIGNKIDAFTKQNKMIDKMEKSNEIAQQKLDQSQQRLDLRKKELDIIENVVQSRTNNTAMQQYGNHVQLQIPPVKMNMEE